MLSGGLLYATIPISTLMLSGGLLYATIPISTLMLSGGLFYTLLEIFFGTLAEMHQQNRGIIIINYFVRDVKNNETLLPRRGRGGGGVRLSHLYNLLKLS